MKEFPDFHAEAEEYAQLSPVLVMRYEIEGNRIEVSKSIISTNKNYNFTPEKPKA